MGLDWTIRDLSPGPDGADAHRTEWRTGAQNIELVVRRARGAFEAWIERDGQVVGLRRAAIPFVADAQRAAIALAVIELDGPTMTAVARGGSDCALFEALEATYRAHAVSMASLNRHGQALRARLNADDMRDEAARIRAGHGVPT